MSSQYFHFTLGPVQSFVGQARRTRDFWAGSFLLSWLSGVAMNLVQAQNGTIIFPEADPNFLDAIAGKPCTPPVQGSIPNRFKAKVDENFSPQYVTAGVQQAWKDLAKEIYQEIAPRKNSNTEEIWQRQIEHFWDMNWVLTTNEQDNSVLDRRKNWRSQYFPDEPGIKCSLMGNWQELSGIVGVSSKNNNHRKEFWEKFRNTWENDFSKKEQLCAISYIKRRFLNHFANFSTQIEFSGKKMFVHGWQIDIAVPSIAYLAAAPWFAQVLEHEKHNEIFKTFFTAAKSLGGLPEQDTALACIEKASTEKKHRGLDGNVFHELALDNSDTFSAREKAREVKRALQQLTSIYGPISPYYAVLVMDGDELGKQMSDPEKQQVITTCLAKFTAAVPDLVKKHNGFLIYAGGDDVLALVTLEDALPCALALRSHYEKCFQKEKAANILRTSISAAIIYTHITTPLKNILHESHELLDQIAKERAGRDALAIRVYKGGALGIEWARKWDEALTENNDRYFLQELQQQFQTAAADGSSFSSKFFYKIRQRFALFQNAPPDHDTEQDFTFKQAIDLLAVDYLQSLDHRKLSMDEAKKIITPLMQQAKNAAADNHITADAALLVRFLAQKGIEGGQS